MGAHVIHMGCTQGNATDLPSTRMRQNKQGVLRTNNRNEFFGSREA